MPLPLEVTATSLLEVSIEGDRCWQIYHRLQELNIPTHASSKSLCSEAGNYPLVKPLVKAYLASNSLLR